MSGFDGATVMLLLDRIRRGREAVRVSESTVKGFYFASTEEIIYIFSTDFA